jgi:hypothetical protein
MALKEVLALAAERAVRRRPAELSSCSTTDGDPTLASATTGAPAETIPRRDLILLPLISLLTILLMTGLAEIASRQIWPEKMFNDCLYKDPVLGPRSRANCATMLKNIEGPWVRYEMNDCGYRGTASCGPKPPGTLRVVIMGNSVAFGLDVPYDEYYANRAAPELSRIWGQPVEFQNLGGVGPEWSKRDVVLNEMISLKPDAVFYMVMPFDLVRMDRIQSAQPDNAVAAPPAKKTSWTWTDVREIVGESRLLFIAQHFLLLRDENFMLRAFREFADPLDVSRQPTPPLVEQRFARLDMMVGKLAARVHAEGVPCYMIAIPSRMEAALISRHLQVAHMDVYIFTRRMQEIAQKHGVEYIDVVPALQTRPNAEELYYPVDGHPTGLFNELLASVVVNYFRHRGSLAEPVAAAVKK